MYSVVLLQLLSDLTNLNISLLIIKSGDTFHCRNQARAAPTVGKRGPCHHLPTQIDSTKITLLVYKLFLCWYIVVAAPYPRDALRFEDKI